MWLSKNETYAADLAWLEKVKVSETVSGLGFGPSAVVNRHVALHGAQSNFVAKGIRKATLPWVSSPVAVFMAMDTADMDTRSACKTKVSMRLDKAAASLNRLEKAPKALSDQDRVLMARCRMARKMALDCIPH